MSTIRTIEVNLNTGSIQSYSDQYLAAAYQALQFSKEKDQVLINTINYEIIRRWLSEVPPSVQVR